MSIKSILFSIAAVMLTFIMSPASAATFAPGCYGGCMPTAQAAPTPSFPADYQCRKNWPLGSWYGPCIDNVSADLNGADPKPQSPTYRDHECDPGDLKK